MYIYTMAKAIKKNPKVPVIAVKGSFLDIRKAVKKTLPKIVNQKRNNKSFILEVF